jgi:hypothetical protein
MPTPFVTTIPAPSATETSIQADAFWPAVDPVKIRAAQRIDGGVTPERLREALIEAMAAVHARLLAWQELQIAAGYATLAAVPCPTIDDAPVHVHRYFRAVGCLAKANVLERLRDYDSSGKGDKKAEASDPASDDLLRDAHWAVGDILGRARTTVELI